MTEKKTANTEPVTESAEKVHFIKEIINEDIANNKNDGRVGTRFPPEPNGYLHIGHAKAICLNFGIAQEYNGTCNLRFDDTNPEKEDLEYVNSIKEDIQWLGFDWKDRLFFASDYFDTMYEHAITLIKKGLAYVDSQSAAEIKDTRGDFTTPGKNSPYRDRSIEENLALFEGMKNGDFEEGSHLLRAKIDMASPNMNLRDPAIYRIRKVTHHRTGDKWCIYPMYDWAHGIEDSIEKITHSLCSLEFENHRPLYEWFLDQIGVFKPQQIEFARLNINYTVMSKRKLQILVDEKHVNGWDDPRLPTISGLRRRGLSPSSIRKFCDRVGVAKREGTIDISMLEHIVRDELNETSARVMAVLNPLKVVIENFKEGETIWFDAPYHPDDKSQGSRKVPLTREIFIERDDFKEEPPKKWFRLAPGKEIRLRYACLIKCTEVIKDKNGEIVELRCTWDPDSKGGKSPDGRKVKGTSHWVSAVHGLKSEVRLYDRLFNVENPLAQENNKPFTDFINKDSMKVLTNCVVEPSLKEASPEQRLQFERLGYFVVDRCDSTNEKLVFNRTVTLRDSWAKIEKKMAESGQQQKNSKKQKAVKTTSKKQSETSEISIDAFSKLDLRVAIIKEAELVEGADKLIRLMVDLGEGRLRQIFAGIREAYTKPEELVGQKVIVVANLKPRKMKFGISEGMVLAGSSKEDNRLAVATFTGEVLPGDTVA